MVSLKTRFLLAAFAISYGITTLAMFLDATHADNKAPWINYTLAVSMVLAIIGVINKEKLVDENYIPRLLISPGHGRFFNSFGPILGFVVCFLLYKRDKPVSPLPLYLAIFGGFISIFLWVVHATPVNADFGLLNTFVGILWVYSLKVYGIAFATFFAAFVCGVLVLVRGHVDRMAIEAAQAPFELVDADE